MIFKKHPNASLKDTNENTFQFSITKNKDKSKLLGMHLKQIN